MLQRNSGQSEYLDLELPPLVQGVFVFILTVPLDIALLPFAAIGGLFG